MQDLFQVQGVSSVAIRCRCTSHRSNNYINTTTMMISTPLAGYLLIRLCQEAKKKYNEMKSKK